MRVLVVGGGIAGLYAAAHLAQRHHEVRLVEQSDALGGRLHTVRDPQGRWQYEAGGARFHDGHTRFQKLLDKLRLSTVPLPGDFRHAPRVGDLRSVDIEEPRQRYCHADLGRRGGEVTTGDHDAVNAADLETLRQEVGYDAEFQLSHARDCQRSVCRDLAAERSFSIVQEGMSEVIARLARHAQHNGARLETGVTMRGYRQDSSAPPRLRVTLAARGQPEEEDAFDALVLAVPLDAMLQVEGVPEETRRTMRQHLTAAPLMRIYASWPRPPPGEEPWWVRKGLHKTTVHRERQGCEHLQFFIPLGNPHVVMASYSDGETAEWWRALEQRDESGINLRDALVRELRAAFGADVPVPDKVMPHFWPAGVHMFTPRPMTEGDVDANDRDLVHTWTQPDPTCPTVVVANEAFALQHQWIEGSLDSVCLALQALQRASHSAR